MSRDWAKLLSHWAEIPSQDHFKIRAFEPLSCDLSHWAMISPSQPLSPQTKSEPPSFWAEIRAIELRYEPSRVEPRYLSYSFVTKLKGSTPITPWVWGGMLRNKFHCIPHCLDVFIIIYSCPINRTSHKYCKHTKRILIKI